MTIFRLEAATENAAKFVLRDFCRRASSIPPRSTKTLERRGKVVVALVLVPFPDADLAGGLPVRHYMFAPWLEDSIRQPDPNLPSDPLPLPPHSLPPALPQPSNRTKSALLRPDADAPEGWLLRIRVEGRGLYLENSERRSAITRFSAASPLLGLPPATTTPSSTSDFDGFGYGLRLKAEGNWHRISPQLSLEALSVEGTEETRGSDTNVAPKNDLLLTALTLDLGVGYRLDFFGPLTFVPSVSYTLDYQHHARSGLRVGNGFALDLNRRQRESADQRVVGEGISAGLTVEYTYDWRVTADLFLVYTLLHEVETNNDLTRSFQTSGYLLRGGGSLTYWLLPQVSIRLGVEAALRDVAESGGQFALGGAYVRQPRSFTVWGGVALGVQVKF